MSSAPGRIAAIAAAALLLSIAVGCAVGRARPAPEPGGVEHVVLVWLKDPDDVDAREALVEASLGFVRIEGVLAVRVGPPIESDRPIVQDDFDLAIVVTLRDRAALAAYLAHPDHASAGRTLLAPAAARVLVYDVEVARGTERAPGGSR